VRARACCTAPCSTRSTEGTALFKVARTRPATGAGFVRAARCRRTNATITYAP
jgi:hypothetical protein